ncbi:MAG: alpha/beta hydrolase [Anaerolineales bacterium]|uniref:Alpha/beta hydrolase n=1 Tax=Candidatus Desulfolinea nitratireducens TaxID=2841698 RepID=A0A8J6NQI9_9CHLR|nr:alpha/beta hydrolase [Candidatus Desulfolinea nitratireducens]MBL6961447.1 alpha/beta hydrolase [Anaerolineales bacterium]
MLTKLRNSIFRTLLKLIFKKYGPIEESRANSERSAKWMGKLPASITVEKVNSNGLNAEWIYNLDSDPEKVILYLHGGGYVIGNIALYRLLSATLSQKTKARVFLPEYRLAPEHPYPAAVDDAVAAYRWLLGEGFRAENIIIAGDSAGGGLSLAATLSLRAEGQPLPAGVICLSPWTDLSLSGESHQSKAKAEAMLLKESLRLWASSYAVEADLRNPLISPVFADFAGFPPLLIQVGSEEILLDDSVLLAENAKSADVDMTLTIYEGMWHVWQTLGFLPESRAAIEEIGAFVKRIER